MNFLAIDSAIRSKNCSRYELVLDNTVIRYRAPSNYSINGLEGFVEELSLEDIYVHLENLNTEEIILIKVDRKEIVYEDLSSLLKALSGNFILSYHSIEVFYIEDVFFRIHRNSDTGELINIFRNDFFSLKKAIGDNIRFISWYKDISADEFEKTIQ